MHLLVLSAFRPSGPEWEARRSPCLNAPSGAQCFPTIYPALPDRTLSPSLNAPSGAQCFPTQRQKIPHRQPLAGLNAPSGAQCFPTGTVRTFG